MAKQTATKQEALILGQKLLQTHGFNGFSFQDIADSLGIRKASLHYHFKSKQDLASALIDDFGVQFSAWTLRQRGKDEQEQLRSYLKLFLAMIVDDQKICPLGAFCVEIEKLDDQVVRSLRTFYELQQRWLSAKLSEVRSESDLKKRGGAETLAKFIMSSLQGSLQTARLQTGPAQAKKHVQEQIKLIEALVLS